MSVGQTLRAIIEKAAVNRFGVAMWAYVLSMGLVAVSTAGGGSVLGGQCAYWMLMVLVSPIVDSRFFETKAAVYMDCLP